MNAEINDYRRLDDEMTEVALLVPRQQIEAAVRAARAEGLTVAQFVRRALHQALHQYVLPNRPVMGSA